MPVNSRKSIKRMDTAEAHAFEIWDKSLPLVVSETNSLDKAVGALVGLAVGDAVGTAQECKRRDSELISDMQGGGPYRLNPGEWTADTSMALCVAQTYLCKEIMHTDVLRQWLLTWYQTGENSSTGRCLGIGNTTRFALEQYKLLGQSWYGNTGNIPQATPHWFVRHPFRSFVENRCGQYILNPSRKVERHTVRWNLSMRASIWA